MHPGKSGLPKQLHDHYRSLLRSVCPEPSAGNPRRIVERPEKPRALWERLDNVFLEKGGFPCSDYIYAKLLQIY
jgi:hypothetical protein